MTGSAYITRMSAFMPHRPVGNDEMEDILGRIGGQSSRARRIVLKNNGIQTRHYVIDPETGKPTYNNAQLTAEAVRGLESEDFALERLDLLACGTSSPDQIQPNHGVMVHGELRNPPCEVVATSGICVSGTTALKYACTSVMAGLSEHAVATGSEVASTYMQAKNFEKENEARVEAMEKRPEIAFEKDFLRWMLSDGAGAALIEPQPRPGRLSLRVDWIEVRSYANELEACMYGGADKMEDGRLKGWREYNSMDEVLRQSVFSVKQDVKLLNEHVIRLTVSQGLSDILKKRPLEPGDVTWFLPHYSSRYFRDKVYQGLADIGFEIPEERWFTNLPRKGNVGAASIYLMLEELFNEGRFQDGDRILCYVPESGRFTTAFMLLTAVGE